MLFSTLGALASILEFGQWNDALCTSTVQYDNVGPTPLRPICKKEQTVLQEMLTITKKGDKIILSLSL